MPPELAEKPEPSKNSPQPLPPRPKRWQTYGQSSPFLTSKEKLALGLIAESHYLLDNQVITLNASRKVDKMLFSLSLNNGKALGLISATDLHTLTHWQNYQQFGPKASCLMPMIKAASVLPSSGFRNNCFFSYQDLDELKTFRSIRERDEQFWLKAQSVIEQRQLNNPKGTNKTDVSTDLIADAAEKYCLSVCDVFQRDLQLCYPLEKNHIYQALLGQQDSKPEAKEVAENIEVDVQRKNYCYQRALTLMSDPSRTYPEKIPKMRQLLHRYFEDPSL